MKSLVSTRLNIFVVAENASQAFSWTGLNSIWLKEVSADIYWCVYRDSGLKISRIARDTNAGDAGSQTDADVPLAAIAQEDIVLAEPGWHLLPGWLPTVKQVEERVNLRSACGRLLGKVQPNGARLDKAPSMLAPYVESWRFLSGLHGAFCGRLPSNVLWVSRSWAPMLVDSMARAQNLNEAIEEFYNSPKFDDVKDVYLADVKAIQY